MARRKLLLFDINGTLLDTGGAGLAALIAGMQKAFNVVSEFPEIELAGATDSGIVKLLFEYFEIPQDAESIEKFYQAYLEHLRSNLRAPGSTGRLLPGINRLLQVIHDETSHVTALLTGNIRRGAYIKIDHYGIDHFFPFGAFGDDHQDRNQLGPIAIRRALEHREVAFRSEEVVVIGDTPRDIHCAAAINAHAIIVATGSFSANELRDRNPHHLFDDFEDTQAVLAAINKN